jgi:hypothetical protein
MPAPVKPYTVFCIEQLARISIETLEVLDPIYSDRTPRCTVWRGGSACGTAEIRVRGDGLRLVAVRIGAGRDVPINLDVRLHRHRMPHGGARLAFRCPVCDRPCRLLFLVSRTICCRRCSGLSYWQQRVPMIDRGSNMAERYRRRLRLGPHDPAGAAKRPRYMRRATFEILKRAITSHENRAFCSAFRSTFGRL